MSVLIYIDISLVLEAHYLVDALRRAHGNIKKYEDRLIYWISGITKGQLIFICGPCISPSYS